MLTLTNQMRLLADTDLEKLLDATNVNQALNKWEGTYMIIMENSIPGSTLPRYKNPTLAIKGLKRTLV